ncbi:Na+/H+ antiporter subunit E [Streptosporangium sp. KLBMP 9127]|nr:Na+/H+ antiporter subunit E [Streptosporangium sp. KLBMP 9127]
MRPAPIIGLAAIWVLMWGNLSVANVLSGVLVAVLITWLTRLPRVGGDARIAPWGCVRLLGWFLADMVISSSRVAWQAVRPGPPPVCAVIAVTLRSRSDLTMTVTALTLSAVPGSLVVEVRRSAGILYLHVLGVDREHDLEHTRLGVLALEARVIRAIGSGEERGRLT